MNRHPRVLLHILSQLILVFTLVSCTSGVNPNNDAGGNQSSSTPAEATPLPTVTPTVEPTATHTVEPTESPAQIADELKLKDTPQYETRTFAVEERNGTTYLTDQYNDAPKAALEGWAWRRLDYTNEKDAEAMYGALAPEGGEYIRTGMMGDKDGPFGRLVGPRYLGDWEVRPIDYSGEQINVYYLLAGLRDGDGKLHILRIAYDSPDIGEHHTELECGVGGDTIHAPGSGMPVHWPLAETLAHLRPGERVSLWVYERNQLKEYPYYEHPDYPLILNSRQSDMVTKLYNQHPEVFQGMSAGDRAALDRMEWPDKVLEFSATPWLIVSRSTEADCAK